MLNTETQSLTKANYLLGIVVLYRRHHALGAPTLPLIVYSVLTLCALLILQHQSQSGSTPDGKLRWTQRGFAAADSCDTVIGDGEDIDS